MGTITFVFGGTLACLRQCRTEIKLGRVHGARAGGAFVSRFRLARLRTLDVDPGVRFERIGNESKLLLEEFGQRWIECLVIPSVRIEEGHERSRMKCRDPSWSCTNLPTLNAAKRE